MSGSDGVRLALKQVSTVDKYHDGDTEPYERSVIEEAWTELDGTPITDPDRIARLENAAMTTIKEGQKVIVTRDDGTEAPGTMLIPNLMPGVAQIADEYGLPRSVPVGWVTAAPAADEGDE